VGGNTLDAPKRAHTCLVRELYTEEALARKQIEELEHRVGTMLTQYFKAAIQSLTS
jgi:hypothetical protein